MNTITNTYMHLLQNKHTKTSHKQLNQQATFKSRHRGVMNPKSLYIVKRNLLNTKRIREMNDKKVNTRSIIRTFLDSKLASILSWISLYFEKAMSQKRKKKNNNSNNVFSKTTAGKNEKNDY